MRSRFSYAVIAMAAALLLLAGCQSGAAPQPAPKAGEPAKAAAPTQKPAQQPAPAAKPADVGAAPANYPDKPMALDVSGEAGGGLDMFSRSVEEALRKENLFTGTVTIKHHGGGGGNIGMSYLAEQRGSAYIMMCNTNRVYLNPMMGTTKLKLDDFTPIARMMTDYMILAVRKDSPLKSGQDLIDKLKKDPKSVSLGIGSAPPTNDYLHLVYMAKEAGIDPGKMNMVVFKAGGDLNAKLLGGHVDAISTTLAESLPQFKSGDIRILAVTSQERIDEAKDVPTWTEQKVPVVVKHWRAMFGPPEMPKYALDWWVNSFTKMVKTPTWKQILERNGWQYEFLAGEELKKALQEEAKKAEETLAPLGVLPQKK